MSITTSCPGCKSLFRLPNDLAGQEVRCQKCAQLFAVPMPTTGATEPSDVAPEAPPEGPPPAAPSEEAPSVAAQAPQTPAADVVMPTLAAANDEKPTQPPMPKPSVPAERSASVLGALALLLLFLLSMFGIGAFATIWIVTHLSPPLPVTSGPPLHAVRDGNQNFDFGNAKDRQKDNRVFDDKPQAVVPQQINFGFDNKVIVNSRTDQALFIDHGKWNQDGPYRLYRIRLQEGTTYNFYVGALQCEPRLRIFDGEELVAQRSGQAPHDVLMVSYQPKRTRDHVVWITTQERVFGNISLIVAREARGNPVPVDMTLQHSYTAHQLLRVEDPLDPGANRFGPYHDYEVKLDADREYTISIASEMFRPVLRIDDNKPVAPPNFGPVPPQINHIFRPTINGKHRVRVTSDQFGTGLYVLKIEPKPITLQRIIAALDDKGSFTEQRELHTSDPKVAGRGSYKEYLLGDLEKGRKYRIEMSLGDSPTALTLLDPENIEVKSVTGEKNASLTFVADHHGTYRIRAFAPLPKNRAAYTLRIITEP